MSLLTWMPAHRALVHTLAVVAGGLAIMAVYAFPGIMAYDSFDQLLQARSGTLTDWHPPIMSALWGVLDRIVAGPALMLILQCSLFLAGLYVLLRRRMSPRGAAIATLVVFAWPPHLSMMAVIVKDSLLVGALLAGCAAIGSRERRWQLASLVLFGFAAALRYNSVAIVVPLLAWLSPWSPWRGKFPRLVRAATGVAIAIAVTAAGWVANRALTDVATHPFHTSVAPMDIVGTLHFADPLSDAEIKELLDGVPLGRDRDLQRHASTLYDPNRHWGGLIRGPERFLDEPLTADARDAVTAGWLRLIRAHPGAYLSSRADIFREMLGLTDVKYTAVYGVNQERGVYRMFGLEVPSRNVVQKVLARRMVALGLSSIIFRPYLYLVIAIALAITMRRDPLVIAWLASAFANMALLFLVSPSTDIRYVHWLMLVATIGFVLRIAEAFRASPSSPRGD